jgi:hypothetical protein
MVTLYLTRFDVKKNNLLSVENFQDNEQDIGRGAYKFRCVLDVFKQARDALYYPSKYPLESYLAEFITIDDFIRKRALKKIKLNNNN